MMKDAPPLSKVVDALIDVDLSPTPFPILPVLVHYEEVHLVVVAGIPKTKGRGIAPEEEGILCRTAEVWKRQRRIGVEGKGVRLWGSYYVQSGHWEGEVACRWVSALPWDHRDRTLMMEDAC